MLNELAKEAYETACSKGFHETTLLPHQEMAIALALIHSEVSEVLEEVRADKPFTANYYPCDCRHSFCHKKDFSNHQQCTLEYWGTEKHCCYGCTPTLGKPEGVPAKFADILIRIFDTCGLFNIDLDAAVKEKMLYNKSRSRKHGDKTL